MLFLLNSLFRLSLLPLTFPISLLPLMLVSSFFLADSLKASQLVLCVKRLPHTALIVVSILQYRICYGRHPSELLPPIALIGFMNQGRAAGAKY